jgi:hypothetical protein
MDEPKKLQGKHIGNAFVAWLVVAIGYVFVIPWKIWSRMTVALSDLREEGGIVQNLQKSKEFIILNWLKYYFDAVIFIIWPLGVLVNIILLIIGTNTFGMFLGALVVLYFIPIALQLLKEGLIIALVQVMKMEEIADNTKH